MTIEEYFGDWSQVLDLKEADRILQKLSPSKAIVCPQIKNIFKAFHLCPLYSTQIVLLGQDPYPTLRSLRCNSIVTKVPVATGLAFANTSDTLESEYSPSLKVLRESVIDFTVPHGILTFDPSLEKWEKQGVLLLNASLSCEVGKAGSHTLLWRPFMTSLLTKLSTCLPGTVYVLMGTSAWSLEPYINKRFNYIIRIRHPAYYARTNTRMPSDIWREVNSILVGQSGKKIEWYEEY